MNTRPIFLGRPHRRVPTAPGFLRRCVMRTERLLLIWKVWSTEQWLSECAAEGITEGRSLDAIRADLERMRCRQAYIDSAL